MTNAQIALIAAAIDNMGWKEGDISTSQIADVYFKWLKDKDKVGATRRELP